MSVRLAYFAGDPRKANSVRLANLGRPSLPSCDGNLLLRKEVIQPHLPVRLPCYDLVPITSFTLGVAFPKVRPTTSGTPGFHHLTGGVYKTRERIHRGMLIRDY